METKKSNLIAALSEATSGDAEAVAQPREIPILFNGQMVKAILDGSKVETRRPLKLQYKGFDLRAIYRDGKGNWIGWERKAANLAETTKKLYPNGGGIKHPMGNPGDTLWVRENWATNFNYDNYKPTDLSLDTWSLDLSYATDFSDSKPLWLGKTRPSIHMPRWANRITLTVVDSWVERIRTIDEAGAKREGVSPLDGSYVESFMALWDSIYKSQGFGWQLNPWVWVCRFKLKVVK